MFGVLGVFCWGLLVSWVGVWGLGFMFVGGVGVFVGGVGVWGFSYDFYLGGLYLLGGL